MILLISALATCSGGSRLKAGMTEGGGGSSPRTLRQAQDRLDPGSALFFKSGMRQRQPCVYLLARASHSTLYVGVTSDLMSRIAQHRDESADGFTKRYGIKRLVWFEMHETMEAAIAREKSIKRWPRAWKYDLIHQGNPTWRDLAEDLGFEPLRLK
jgi:putative endonuclease